MQPLPPWGDDPLSSLMSDADENERLCALKWPDMYEVLQNVHGLLTRIGDLLQADPTDANLGVPRMLIARSRSAILAATRLAMSGQGFETQAALRSAIEQVWYALHIAKDPTPPTRAMIWWDRNVSPEAKKACKNEFMVENVRKTHDGLDATTAIVMRRLYEDTIDFGAHPNQAGIAASLELDKTTETVSVKLLYPGTLAQAGALKATVDVAIGVAKTVGQIYPERFKIAGVDEEINQLSQRSTKVFQKYAKALCPWTTSVFDGLCAPRFPMTRWSAT